MDLSLCTVLSIVLHYILPVIALVQFVRFCRADADLTLLYAERFGLPITTLSKKVIWITGASSGIGEYLAYELAKSCKDIKLILSSRRESELKRVKQACIEYGLPESSVSILPLDLFQYSTHVDKVEKAVGYYGCVDILVNNAGRSQRSFAVKAELSVDQSLIEMNTIGTISLTKSFLRGHAIPRGEGHLVILSSLAGKFGVTGSSAYCASKFALHGFFDSLNYELSAQYNNMHVTLICPGPVVSNVGSNALLDTASRAAGESGMDNSLKMPTDRCAHLISVAIANKLEEVWISYHFPLAMAYFSQYMPTFARWIIKKIAKRKVEAMSSGKLDHGSYFRLLLSSLFGNRKQSATKQD